MRLAVVGAGSWGTTVAALGTRNAEHVSLWARRPELAEVEAERFRAECEPLDAAALSPSAPERSDAVIGDI